MTSTYQISPDRVATVHTVTRDEVNRSLIMTVSVTGLDLPAVPYRVEVALPRLFEDRDVMAHDAEPMHDAWRRPVPAGGDWDSLTDEEDDRLSALAELERAAERAAEDRAREIVGAMERAATYYAAREMRRHLTD